MVHHGTVTAERRDGLIASLRAAGCVFAEDEADLLLSADVSELVLADLVRRRIAGQPLEYLLGWAEFAGLRIIVEPGVFVPRRRTELMATVARDRLHDGGILLDLCCGTGAVAAAVSAVVENVQVFAADCDPAAVRCARQNLSAAVVFEGDLFEALPSVLRRRVDVLVANAPYVPTDSITLMPPEARLHEAPVALNGGPDGLDVLRRVVAGAGAWLTSTGIVLVEAGETQLPTLTAFAEAQGFHSVVHTDDEIGAIVVELRRS